jgi:hypothetical protein
MSSARAARAALGPAAVVSVAQAVEWLPWRAAEARAWLEAAGVIIRRPGLPAPVVRWGDVLVALAEEREEEARPTPVALPRKKLKG